MTRVTWTQATGQPWAPLSSGGSVDRAMAAVGRAHATPRPLLSRAVMMVLDEARGVVRNDGMSAVAIAAQLNALLDGLAPSASGPRARITPRQVSAALVGLARRGHVQKVAGSDRPLRWRPR